jgi:hypothetical protein
MGRCCLDGGNEEGGVPVRFGYSRAEESGRRWHTVRWHRPGATAAQARPRKKKAWVGRCWAERLWWLGPALEFPKKIGMGCHGHWAELMD